MVLCRFCFKEVSQKLVLFSNGTKHLRVNCKKCKKYYYEKKEMTKPGIKEVKSKKLQNLEAKQNQFELPMGQEEIEDMERQDHVKDLFRNP